MGTSELFTLSSSMVIVSDGGVPSTNSVAELVWVL